MDANRASKVNFTSFRLTGDGEPYQVQPCSDLSSHILETCRRIDATNESKNYVSDLCLFVSFRFALRRFPFMTDKNEQPSTAKPADVAKAKTVFGVAIALLLGSAVALPFVLSALPVPVRVLVSAFDVLCAFVLFTVLRQKIKRPDAS